MKDIQYSNLNPALGAVQTDVYTGFTISLPVVEKSLMLFASVISLMSGQAERHSIRKLDQLELNDFSRTPISRQVINDDRIQRVSGSIVSMREYPYGVSLLIDNMTRYNSKENIKSNCIALFADWASRLQESLLFNMLRASGVPYVFSKADTTGGGLATRPNVADCISAKSILDKNRVRRTMMRMIKATDQIGTQPVGQTFIGHVSIEGRAAFQESIPDSEITRPYENPSVSTYLYQNLCYLRRADTSIYHSTEILDDSSSRLLLLHGDEYYVMAKSTAYGNALIEDPEYRSSFGMHTKLSYRLTHSQAILRNERGVRAVFTDSILK